MGERTDPTSRTAGGQTIKGRRGVADDERGRQLHVHRRRVSALHPVAEDAVGHLAHLRERLAHRGQQRRRGGRQDAVVEADHAQLVGHAETEPPGRLHHPEGLQVVGREHGRRPVRPPQDLLGRRHGRCEPEVGPSDEGRVRGQTRVTEGRDVAVVTGVVDQARVAAEQGDPAMAQPEQMLHRRHPALPVAGPDAGQRLDAVDRVDHHQRQRGLREPAVVLRRQVRGRNDQPGSPDPLELVDPRPGVQVLREGADRDVTTVLLRRRDDAPQHLQVVGVAQRVEDQLDVLVGRRQGARAPRQILLIPEDLQDPLRVAGATSGRPLSTLEIVGVETPACRATSCSVMRFGAGLIRRSSRTSLYPPSRRIFETVSEAPDQAWLRSTPHPTLTRVKFTDGYWQLRSGVSARYPAEVNDVVADADSLTVYAPTRPIRQRGDTLNQPLITVRCSAPAVDVLSVSVGHFLGPEPVGRSSPCSATRRCRYGRR